MIKHNGMDSALVYSACLLCGQKTDGRILLSKHVETPIKVKQELDRLHNQKIDVSKEPCKECKKLMKKGFLLIVVDEEKTQDRNDPYRTGEMFVIKKEAAKQYFGDKGTTKAAFIDRKAAKKIGLPIKEDAKVVALPSKQSSESSGD